uniref:Threonine aldolase 1 n=1 Tax=Sinocyclocheilus anshuiensis TaxID=1608454 RepID=A0A671PMR0_9TELE
MSSKTLTIPARLLCYCFHKPRRVFHVDPARLYYGSPQVVTGSAVRTVDLRSDTVTKPGAAMRRAMAEAEVGDDVFGEDPTVNENSYIKYYYPLSLLSKTYNLTDPKLLKKNLCGSKDFIQRAVRARKALGGGMRQSGVLAAAGKIALSDMIGRVKEDHRNAKSFAQALLQCDPPMYQVDLTTVESNILRFRLRDAHMSPAEFCERMAGVDGEEVKALGQGVQVLMFPHVGGTVRAVWHLGISEEDTQLAIQKAHFVAQQHKLKSIRAA